MLLSEIFLAILIANAPTGGGAGPKKSVCKPVVMLKSQSCGNFLHTSESKTSAVSDAEKCAKFVINECPNKKFFTYNSKDKA